MGEPMGKHANSIQKNLWQLLNTNLHLKNLPVEVKHIISSNVARSFRNYRELQAKKLLKEIKAILGDIKENPPTPNG